MIGEKMQQAINEQIQAELGSAYLYLSMVGYFNSIGLGGMANWMSAQTQEEMLHAKRFFDNLIERDGRIELLELEKPQKEWASPLEAFQAAYKHEQYITGRINNLVKIAREENDNAAFVMLQWFVVEQVEEEANASKIVQELELVGDNGHGLLMIDRELSARIPPVTIPVAAEA